MGRDIGFAYSEIQDALHDVSYSPKHKSFVGFDLKSHRTDYGNEEYEDYGVLIWVNQEGIKKKKGKKRVEWEYECYRPKDFVKKWKVPVEPGDIAFRVMCNLTKGSLNVSALLVDNIKYDGFEKYSIMDPGGEVIWEGICERRYIVYTDVIKKYEGDILERNKLLEWIQKEFDTKFWDILEEVTRVPKFKDQKEYKKEWRTYLTE